MKPQVAHPPAPRDVAPTPAIRSGVWLRLSERRLLLAAIDLIVIAASLTAVLAHRFRRPLLEILEQGRLSWYLVLILTYLAAAFVFDTYNLRRASDVRRGVPAAAGSALLAIGIYLLIPYVTPPLPPSRSALLIFVAAVAGSVTLWRTLYALVLVAPALRKRVLIVGGGWAGETLAAAIQDYAAREYELVGFVDDAPQKQGALVAGARVLGTGSDLGQLVPETGASEIVVAITDASRIAAPTLQAIMDCRERGLQVTAMATAYERLTGRVPVEHTGRNLYAVLPIDPDPLRFVQFMKRAIDLLIGAAGAAVTATLLPFVWVAGALEGGRGVFYTQVRVGRGGRPFRFIKFRTMIRDAEPHGPRWAAEDDRRVTRVGRILRRLHLDEIPQSINILKGDLSFVGPRPERPEFVEQLAAQIPFYRIRHAVQPGVTGWAQVNYKYGASVEDALLKLQYDLYYIKHQSLWLDFLIVMKTIPLVLMMRGR